MALTKALTMQILIVISFSYVAIADSCKSETVPGQREQPYFTRWFCTAIFEYLPTDHANLEQRIISHNTGINEHKSQNSRMYPP
ncbi:hypothetical protein P5V15_010440 [Pogonomyrmex californicus]